MKRLALMRHGEALPYESELTDPARALTRRGAADAALMAERCQHEYWQPDLIVTSPARRTLETAQALARGLHMPTNMIVTEPLLYQASSPNWLKIVLRLPMSADNALLVGHNPGISQFAQSLFPLEAVRDFSPATVLALISQAESWQQFADAEIAMRFRAAPR